MGCSTQSDIIKIKLSEYAIIPDAEVIKLKERVEIEKDGEAAFKLSAHYGIGIGDGEKSLYYSELAFQYDYPTAIYNKAISLYEDIIYKIEIDCMELDSDDFETINYIRFLVNKYIKMGYEDTSEIIHDLDEVLDAYNENQTNHPINTPNVSPCP